VDGGKTPNWEKTPHDSVFFILSFKFLEKYFTSYPVDFNCQIFASAAMLMSDRFLAR